MWHGLVAAARTVAVARVVAVAEAGRAPGGVLLVHCDTVLIDVIAVWVVQAAVVQVVGVAVMPDGSVAAAGSVLVVVAVVDLVVVGHGVPPPRGWWVGSVRACR
jgi:hypothetical protein